MLRLLALTPASAEMDRRGNLAASSCHLLILPPSSCLIYRVPITMRRRQFSMCFFFKKSKLSKMLSQSEPVLCLVGVRRRWGGWGGRQQAGLSQQVPFHADTALNRLLKHTMVCHFPHE